MTRHYPFSCKRILANWEHMAHSLVKECLNSVMLAEGHDLQAYRKINPDDLDIVIPMLERARSTLLAKQLYKEVKKLFDQALPFTKCDTPSEQVIQSFLNWMQPVTLEQFQSLKDSIIKLLVESRDLLTEERLRK